MDDIFTIQDEVAAAIVGALIDSFDDLEVKPVSRSDNLAAFEAYRTGLLHWWRRSVAELHLAIGLFAKAPSVESSTDNRIFVRIRGDLTEKREKLTQKTASVPISSMEKGFYAAPVTDVAFLVN